VIRVENLNIKGMTRSARGTVEKPGRNVAQKTGLNRNTHNLEPHLCYSRLHATSGAGTG